MNGWSEKLGKVMLFESCKAVSAAEVAMRAGIALHQKGRRMWACCPIHGEKSPSLMFDEGGKWHCFGCHRGGDAVDFYAALYNIPPLEAARAIAQGAGIQDHGAFTAKPPISPGNHLKQKADAWYRDQWDRCCMISQTTRKMILGAYEARQAAQEAGSSYALPDRFYEWVSVWSAAEQRLDVLQLAQGEPDYILSMTVEEEDEDATTGRSL